MNVAEETVYRYSVEQLQALDFLLKTVIHNGIPENQNFKRNLKLVVERHHSLWHGNFVRVKMNSPENLDSIYQPTFMNGSTCTQNQIFTANPSNETEIELELLQLAWKEFERPSNGSLQPRSIRAIHNKDLSVLFTLLTEAIHDISFEHVTSPIYPYLFDAYCLNAKIRLPFLHLKGETLTLVSIIDLSDPSVLKGHHCL